MLWLLVERYINYAKKVQSELMGVTLFGTQSTGTSNIGRVDFVMQL